MKLIVAVIALCAVGSQALDNGLARTPPMGWLIWERFRCNTNCQGDPNNCVSEKLIMQMADHMAEDGYKDVGYEYVNIDDCWSNKKGRDSQGRLQSDPDRFPNGIKYLADYVHSRGLKLGIYGDYGTKTCAGYPGSLNYLQVDAQTFADWGVDMLKLDGCNSDVSTMKKGYPEMTKYLNQTGRPILFSCSWPDYERAANIAINYTLLADNCNIWRNYDDINDSWGSVDGIINYFNEYQNVLIPAAAPGHFNDPDMIIVGNTGLTLNQSNAQMAMWAILAAPLLMSNDLRSIPPALKDLLQNQEIIKISQDPLGKMGRRMIELPNAQVWVRPLMYSSGSVVILNNGTASAKVTFKLQDVGFTYPSGYEVRDVIYHSDVGHRNVTTSYTYVVPATGALMYYVYPMKQR